MKPPYLKFTNPHPGDLRRSVWEVIEVFGNGRAEYYSGQLAFATGAREGWWFNSSDNSINWYLGPRVKDAMKELRRRYLRDQKKGDRSTRKRTRSPVQNPNRSRRRTSRR